VVELSPVRPDPRRSSSGTGSSESKGQREPCTVAPAQTPRLVHSCQSVVRTPALAGLPLKAGQEINLVWTSTNAPDYPPPDPSPALPEKVWINDP